MRTIEYESHKQREYRGLGIREKVGKYDEPPKFALIGTCCVGKTSIINYFNTIYGEGNAMAPFVRIVNEAAREFFENGWNKETSPLAPFNQSWISVMQFQSERLAEIEIRKKAKEERRPLTDWRILGDRSIMDGNIYLFSTGDLYQGIIPAKQSFRASDHHLHSYSGLLLLDPNGVPYMQDKIRTETPERRMQIHQAYLEWLWQYKIPYTLVSGSFEQRIAQIRRMMELPFVT